MSLDVIITEVGPRDGLQNEPTHLSTETKLDFVQKLGKAGLSQIEIGSFVHPKAVPAMADTDQVTKNANLLSAKKIGLVMNERGFDRALEAGVDGVCIVTVVSESLCQKNNRRSSQEATDTAITLIKKAKDQNLFTRVDIAPAWVCPYEGKTTVEQVIKHTDQIWEYAPDEMALCDTIGGAQPYEVSKLFEVLGDRYDREKLVAHFHDTRAFGPCVVACFSCWE